MSKRAIFLLRSWMVLALVILHIIAAKLWGGGEQYVYNVAAEEARRGHKVIVAVDTGRRDFAARYSQVAAAVQVPIRSPQGLAAVPALRKIVRENGVEIICFHGSNIYLAAVLLKKFSAAKLVFFRHNMSAYRAGFYHRWLFSSTDAVICVSRSVYDLQAQSVPPAARGKLHLVYNGIATKALKKQKIRQREEVFSLGYAGRLVENKGILILLAAVSQLVTAGKNIRLRLCGSVADSFRDKLAEAIARYGLGKIVELVGYTDRMAEFYMSLDAYVLPSIVAESFGLSLCEAMYCGVPVITTDSGAQTEIVANGRDGLIVPAGDSRALADAIAKIYDDRALAAQLSAAGQARASDNFTIGKCVDGLDAVFRQLYMT